MKIFLTGRSLETIVPHFEAAGFQITGTAEDADLIVTHGGDGAMLGAEHKYPGKLKMPIRDSIAAPLCCRHTLPLQIKALRDGELKQTRLPKLSGTANGQTLKALNDVFIHNSNYVSAMRYKVWIDNELYGREIVGDGVGLSTVHGSTAYYRSITHSVFRTGIGLAFSNSTELVNHLVLPETAVVRVQILRGPAERRRRSRTAVVRRNYADPRTGIFHVSGMSRAASFAAEQYAKWMTDHEASDLCRSHP